MPNACVRGVAQEGTNVPEHAFTCIGFSHRLMHACCTRQGACKMQKTSPVCSAALGRTMICALMMGQGKKDGSMYGESERETLQVGCVAAFLCMHVCVVRDCCPCARLCLCACVRTFLRAYVFLSPYRTERRRERARARESDTHTRTHFHTDKHMVMHRHRDRHPPPSSPSPPSLNACTHARTNTHTHTHT